MLCPAELATLVNALSIAIAKDKSVDELSALAVIFTQVADTLATMAVQIEHIEDSCNNKKKQYYHMNY